MILSNLINLETHTATAKFILYAILERAEYENKDTFLIGQTYMAKLCATSPKTINRELKYLQEQGYITYKRALYNNLATTEITLTEKSIALLSRPQDAQIKTQETAQTQAVNKTICNNKKTHETTLKQAAEEQTEIPQTPINGTNAHETSLQEKFNRLSRINKIQCKILKDSNFNENYVKLAVEDYKIPFDVIQGIQNNKIVIS